MKTYAHVIGIDLGTTNTLACYLKGGKPELIRFPGGKMLPSVLFVDALGNVIVGNNARKRGIIEPSALIRSSKTYIGDNEANKTWTCHGKTFTPTDVATEILKEVRKNVVKQLKCDPDEEIGAVITVPAYFNSNQRDETRIAGQAAGFDVVQIVTEPMAAAVAAVRGMGLDNKKVFVVDLGGGTFDLSVLVANSAKQEYSTLGIDGDHHLGGDDFDQLLTEWLLPYIKDNTDIDMSSLENSGLAEDDYLSRLFEINKAVEKAKIELSDEEETDIDILHFGDVSLQLTLDRKEFEQICEPLFERINTRIKKFLNSGKFNRADLGETILAGGSCYIPRVKEDVEAFGVPPANSSLDRSTLVVIGAANIAEQYKGGMSSSRMDMHDILPHSLGVAVQGEECEIFAPILTAGNPYPCSRSDIFTTVADNQESVLIKVYETGPDCEGMPDLEKHKFYGTILLEGIEIAKAREPQIEVSFDYDQSGCLTVSAQDKKTGARKSATMVKGAQLEEPGKQKPMDLILLMDTSGSMSGEPLRDAKIASRALINELVDLSINRLGLVSFADNARVLNALSQDRAALLRAVDALDANGMTYMEAALRSVDKELKDDKRKKVIILVTDGYDSGNKDATDRFGDELKDKNIRIITIGAGSGVDEGFLKKLASPDDYYKINDMSELRKTFETVISGLSQK